jgi:hypothetical protein
MRRLTHALLAIAGVIMGAGVAIAAPVLHLSGWKASAGKPETFTITRIGGNGPATVTFKTVDGSATAPTDYTAVTQTITWPNGQTSMFVSVPTFVNMAKAGTNIQFTATISSASGTSSAVGLIMEPPAPIPSPPAPAPIITNWMPGPLAVGGYAFVPDMVGTPPVVTQCCNGLIVRFIAHPMSTDVVPVPIWLVSYYTDTRGEAANADQLRLMVGQQSNLVGVVPAP